jgi:hypothetical protein
MIIAHELLVVYISHYTVLHHIRNASLEAQHAVAHAISLVRLAHVIVEMATAAVYDALFYNTTAYIPVSLSVLPAELCSLVLVAP